MAQGNAIVSEVAHPDPDELLTPREVADLWRVSAYWVEEQARLGRIPEVWMGKHRRFRRADLDAFVQERRRVRSQ